MNTNTNETAATTEKLHAVAAILGGIFEPRKTEYAMDPAGTFILPAGVRMWVSSGGYSYKGRIHFSPSYPRHQTERGGTNTVAQRDFDRTLGYGERGLDVGITVSDLKTPEQIAKDLERRLLAQLRPLYALAVEYCAKQDEYVDKRETNGKAAREIAAGVPGLYVDYVTGDGATFKVTVAAAHFKALAEFLKGL